MNKIRSDIIYNNGENLELEGSLALTVNPTKNFSVDLEDFNLLNKITSTPRSGSLCNS
jgi:hypothetical protein